MKKLKIRRADATGTKTLKIGYCQAQNLLSMSEPFGFNSGVYGWNFDSYEVNGVVINTGYRGMPGVSVDYELLKRYELEAEKIIYNYSRPYEERRQALQNLLIAFIKEV